MVVAVAVVVAVVVVVVGKRKLSSKWSIDCTHLLMNGDGSRTSSDRSKKKWMK